MQQYLNHYNHFLNKYLSQPEFVEVDGKAHNKENIEYLIPTKGSAKVDKTLELIDILNISCIIFCNSREMPMNWQTL